MFNTWSLPTNERTCELVRQQLRLFKFHLGSSQHGVRPPIAPPCPILQHGAVTQQLTVEQGPNVRVVSLWKQGRTLQGDRW